MKEEIKKKILQNVHKRLILYSHKSIYIHTKTIKAMLFTLSYIVLFILIVLLQSNLTQRYDQISVKTAIENKIMYPPQNLPPKVRR